jgi:hypothetical protein
MTRTLLFFICLLVTPSFVGAQDRAGDRYTERSFMFLWPGQSESDARLNLNDPIVTDRPDFTEASSTVGEGVLQAEMGYTYYYDGAASPHEASHVYPELLLRAGVVADWLELRLGQTLVTFDEPGSSSTGFADMYLGVKLGVVPEYGLIPELSIVPQLTVPSGAADQRADQVLYGVNFLYSWSILSESYIGASTQWNQREGGDTDDIYTSFAQALVTGTRWDTHWGTYVEWFGLFANSAIGEEDAHYVNGGITYLFTKDLQLDVRLGSRLQDRFGEEIFTGIGLSVRYL